MAQVLCQSMICPNISTKIMHNIPWCPSPFEMSSAYLSFNPQLLIDAAGCSFSTKEVVEKMSRGIFGPKPTTQGTNIPPDWERWESSTHPSAGWDGIC